jgi:hypothetical protein
MGHVTEAEILACLIENFRLAAGHCVDLAWAPARGPIYRMLREELKLAEGCCRQLSAYREDTRWLSVGLMMAEAHKRSLNWLLKHPRTVESNMAHPLFLKLGENLLAAMARAIELRDRATGRAGPILPLPTRTEGRAVSILLP